MKTTALGDGWKISFVSTADVNPAKGGPELHSAAISRGGRIVYSFRFRDHTDGRPPATEALEKMSDAIQLIRREMKKENS